MYTMLWHREIALEELAEDVNILPHLVKRAQVLRYKTTDSLGNESRVLLVW